MTNMLWQVGDVEIVRIPYFDIGLPADSIGLDGVAEAAPWAQPWLTDGLPTVGQAFWLIRSGGMQVIVDPAGASDAFLRTGADAIAHQDAAFAMLRAAGCQPDEVDALVLTHLDGIGMAALADGADAGQERWTAAFTNAPLLMSQGQYDYLQQNTTDQGWPAFAQLDAAGVVQPVEPPHQLAPGVTMQLGGDGHTPGHCCVVVESAGERAVLLGHLAISPLHASEVAQHTNHVNSALAATQLQELLHSAATNSDLVAGSLWPYPGLARVTGSGPYEVVPEVGAVVG